jgi:hypothetical protein
VAKAVRLRTWPELENVDITAEPVEFSMPQFPTRDDPTTLPYVPIAHVEIRPVVPLADRWYVLSLAAQRDVHLSERFHLRLADGSMGVRFRVGSQVAIREVRHVVDQGVSHVVVEFSERVRVAPGMSPEIRFGDRSVCSLPAGTVIPESGFKALAFACSEGEPPAALRMGLAGITGARGGRLTPIPPATSIASDISLGVHGRPDRFFRP